MALAHILRFPFVLLLGCLMVAGLAHADSFFISPKRQFKPFGEKTTETKGQGEWASQFVRETSTNPEQPYSIDYNTGRASMDIWEVECGVDPIHKFKWCRSTSGQLQLYEDSRGRFALIVGRNHFPRTNVYVRADSEKTVVTQEPGWSGDMARILARRLSKAKQIHSRYWEWPRKSDVDESRAPNGMALALDYLRFATQR